jgi:hypothetical protein
MTTAIDKALRPLESAEPLLQDALKRMGALLEHSDAQNRLAETQLYTVNYSHAPASVLKGPYYTANCAALYKDRVILLNESYLLETEAAIRSFNLGPDLFAIPYLRSDQDLFALVRRVSAHPDYLGRLRALDRLPGRDDAQEESLDTLAMALLFLVGHELGHLDEGHDQRSFGAFVDPRAPLETKLGNAVVKLSRHARELTRLGFGLPGFEHALDDAAVGADARRWRETLTDLEARHKQWFDAESAADDFAAVLVQHVLDRIAAIDPVRSDQLLVRGVNALFAMALYQWQRDLDVFLGKLGLRELPTPQDLSILMMQKREHYVHAAELFGPVHRFTLLRAILAINGWLHARGALNRPIDKAVSRTAPVPNRPLLDASAVQHCWRREVLLRIHLDTAIKIANVGSVTGWMLETDVRRGTPQLFVMTFESIARAMQRLHAMSR